MGLGWKGNSSSPLFVRSLCSESLIERAVLQASPGIVGCNKRLVLTRRMGVRGWNTIDCPLKDRNKVFFEIRISYLERGSGDDRGD